MNDLKPRIREIFARWQQEPCPGGQVFVSRNGEVLFDEALGWADLERDIKNTPDTIFHVASVSKQITCMCVLLLWERGKIDIDADIRAYIPDLVNFSEPVTVRNLMNNVSGIRDQWSLQVLGGVRGGDIITQSDLLTLCARQKKLNFEPETQYLYSNTNFTYLAEMVRRLSGMSFAEFARENIFKPLGMENTFIREEYTDMVPNRALSFEAKGETYKWVPLNFSNWGATSLHTTARDFSKWLNTFMNPTICKPETLKEMLTVPALKGEAKTTYACGVQVTEYKGHRLINHDGADAGYRASANCFPADGLTIMVTANAPTLNPQACAMKIADLILGLEATPTAQDPLLTEEEIDPIPGDWFTKSLGVTVKIIREGEGYVLRFNENIMPLKREKGNQFAITGLPLFLYFKEGAPWMNIGGPQKLTPSTPATFTPQEQAALCGTYYSDEVVALYDVTAQEDKLYVSHKRFGKGQLWKAEEGYTCQMEHALHLRFHPEEGTVDFLGDRVKCVTFTKVNL